MKLPQCQKAGTDGLRELFSRLGPKLLGEWLTSLPKGFPHSAAQSLVNSSLNYTPYETNWINLPQCLLSDQPLWLMSDIHMGKLASSLDDVEMRCEDVDI